MPEQEKVIRFPTTYVSAAQAWEIVKFRLGDETIALPSKLRAIEVVARFETINSITKDELQSCLRWLFDHYDFEGDV